MLMRRMMGLSCLLLVLGALALALPGCSGDQNAGGGAGASPATTNPAPPGTPPETAQPKAK